MNALFEGLDCEDLKLRKKALAITASASFIALLNVRVSHRFTQ